MLFFKHLEQLQLKKHPIIQNLHNDFFILPAKTNCL
jgi:hypothetical protein